LLRLQRDVLDDTLDFSKLSNNSPEEIEAAQKRSLARHDLETLAEDVSKAVWVRKKRVDLVSADANASNAQSGKRRKSSTTSEMLPGKVDVVLEVQERGEGEGGWGVWVDAGGMKRVLLNILGVRSLNSLSSLSSSSGILMEEFCMIVERTQIHKGWSRQIDSL